MTTMKNGATMSEQKTERRDEYTVAANDTSSTHPYWNGARVRVVEQGFPRSDPDAFVLVALVKIHDTTPKGAEFEVRRRDLRPVLDSERSPERHDPENEREMIEQRFRSVTDKYPGDAPPDAYVEARKQLQNELAVEPPQPPPEATRCPYCKRPMSDYPCDEFLQAQMRTFPAPAPAVAETCKWTLRRNLVWCGQFVTGFKVCTGETLYPMSLPSHAKFCVFCGKVISHE